MSQDPYQSDPHYQPEFESFEIPPRTSLLAIGSLITAIPCLIPGVGLLSAILGGVSLGLIRKSEGRLSGRAAAIAGIFLGILVTVIQAAIFIGVTQAYTYYSKQMGPVAETFFVSASQGDYDAARDQFTANAQADITDERLASFIQAIQANRGAITGATTGFAELFESFGQVYSGSRSHTTVINNQKQDSAPIPFRIDTDTGSFVGVALFDPNTFSAGPLKLVDAMAILPGAKAVVLREDGPASDFAAAAYSVTVISHAEAIEQAAKAKAAPAPDADSTPVSDAPTPPDEPAPPSSNEL